MSIFLLFYMQIAPYITSLHLRLPMCSITLLQKRFSTFPKRCWYGLGCHFLNTICRLIFCGNLYGFQVRIQLDRPAYLVFKRKESNRSIPILVHSLYPHPPSTSPHSALTWRYFYSFEMESDFQAAQLNFSQKFHLPECSQY